MKRRVGNGRVDGEGRVTLPKSVLESLQIGPGEEVSVELAQGQIVIRPLVSRDEFIEQMVGCVNEETRRADAAPTDPRDQKTDWTSG